jgi:hypothetical protein
LLAEVTAAGEGAGSQIKIEIGLWDPMRNNYLSSADLAIWLALIASQVILCVCVLGKRVVNRLPWFSVYVFGFTAENVMLFAIAFWGSYAAYYYVFFYAGHIVSALAFLTLIEFARQVLPGLDLPRKEKAAAALLAALAAIAVFVSVWPLQFLEKRIEVGAHLGIATAFIFITVYSRSLSLRWSRLLGGVAFTLGILYLVRGVTKALIGHYPPTLVLHVRQGSEIANVLAAISWIVVVLSPWGEQTMTEEDLLKFQQVVGAIEGNFRRFIEKEAR